MRLSGWLGVVALVLSASPAWADTPEPRPLSYEEVVREVLVANPDLVAAGHTLSAAEGLLEAARGDFDPSFGLQAQVQHINTTGYFQGVPFKSLTNAWDVQTGVSGLLPVGTSYALTTSMDRNRSAYVTDFGLLAGEQLQDAFTSRIGLSITQNLLRGVQRAYNLKDVSNAERVVGKAELRAEQARQLMVASATEAYWDWAYQYGLLQIRQDTVRAAEDQVRVAQLRVKGDAMPRAEMARLQSGANGGPRHGLGRTKRPRRRGRPEPAVDGSRSGRAGDAFTLLEEVHVPSSIGNRSCGTLLMEILGSDLRPGSGARKVGEGVRRAWSAPEVSTTLTTGVLGQQDSAAAALGNADSYPYVTVMGNVTVPLGNRVAKRQRSGCCFGL